MNGNTFKNLKHLSYVDMTENVCIKEHFTDSVVIATMPQVVTEKCGYTEDQTSDAVEGDDTSKLLLEEIHEEQKRQNLILENFMNKTVVEKDSCESTLTQEKKEVKRLEAEIKLSKVRHDQELAGVETQFNLFQKKVLLKLREIEDLFHEQQRKKSANEI